MPRILWWAPAPKEDGGSSPSLDAAGDNRELPSHFLNEAARTCRNVYSQAA